MILETEALEPKAGSATSVYLAVIVSVAEGNGVFSNLQIYCPEVMSGDIEDAKFSLNNWIQAPSQPHEGITENFEVGGVVLVSYQNGNISCPQFVSNIPIADDVKAANKRIIDNNIRPTVDSGLFDNIGADVGLDSPGIKKGLALLEAVKAGAKKDISIYAYDKGNWDHGLGNMMDKWENTDYVGALTIQRFGKYGTEFVLNKKEPMKISQFKYFTSDPYKANFDYLYSSDEVYNSNYYFYRIVKEYLYKKYGDKIVDVANAAIREVFPGDSLQFDKTNLADVAYLYVNLAGLVYSDDEKEDMTKTLFPELAEEIKSKDIKPTIVEKLEKSDAAKLLYSYKKVKNTGKKAGATSLYHGFDLVKKNDREQSERDKVKKFNRTLWKKLCDDKEFDEMLSSRYAMILSSFLQYFKETHKVSSLSNKMLMVIATLSVAYPSLYKAFKNVDLAVTKDETKSFKDNLSEQMIVLLNKIKSSLSTDGSTPPHDEFAKDLKDLYYVCLEWRVDIWGYTSRIKRNCFDTTIGDHYDVIQEGIKGCLDYIGDNLESLKEIMNSSAQVRGSSGNLARVGDRITLQQLKNAGYDKKSYLELVTPIYKEYCKQYGLKYPGILALQVFYEVNANFPRVTSRVAEADNNLGGLKYHSNVPGVKGRGTPVPNNETGGNYCRFDCVSDYYLAHVWQVGTSEYYQTARNKQSSVRSFARCLCATWIKGNINQDASGFKVGYSDDLVTDYNYFGLSKYDN